MRERSLTQLTPLGRRRCRRCGWAFASNVPTQPFSPLFGELMARLPGFELSFEDATSAGLCEALLHGTLDAAVVTGDAALPDRLNRWPLFSDAAALMMPPGHALDTGDAVPLAALDGAAVICRSLDCRMVRLLEQAQRDHGARPAHQYRVASAGRVADLVRAGLGVALSTELTAVPDGLQMRPVARHAAHDVLLVAVAGRPFTRTAEAFIKLARAREWGMTSVTASGNAAQGPSVVRGGTRPQSSQVPC